MPGIQLSDLVLKPGSHISPENGMCIMEAVAYFANEPHSDSPKCACPVLSSYMRILNDQLYDNERQLLKPYIKRLIGTKDGNSQKRANILAWYSIVKFTPHCLRLIGLESEANKLQSLNKFDWNGAYRAAITAYKAASAAYSTAIAAYGSASVAYKAASAVSAADSAARAASADSAAYNAARAANSAAYSIASTASAADSDKTSARKQIIDLALTALDEALEVK